MANFIYSSLTNTHNAAIGKLETPLRMVIENESDVLTKKGGPRDWLFIVLTSKRFGETIVGQNEFDVFAATEEGADAPHDGLDETYKKFIEHIQYMKTFTITAKMMEDSNYSVGAEERRRAENFTRAYYKTMHRICEAALVGGTGNIASFAGASIDVTAPDGLSLFNTAHTYGKAEKGVATSAAKGTQSNYFEHADLFKDTTAFEEALGELASKIRNMKDENGDPLGYTADTIILPGNTPKAERIAKKVCGSEGALGNGYNDINIQYGNWNIVVLPDWQATNDAVMIMSSEANKNLGGNMFYNRIPLSINPWVDNPNGNMNWTGRCRFGVGFGAYKHILLCTSDTTASATQL